MHDSPSRSHWWCGTLFPRERFGFASLVCLAGLVALLFSAASPADDSAQPALSGHLRNGQRIVTAARLFQTNFRLVCNYGAPAITLGGGAAPVCSQVDHSLDDLPASLRSSGFANSLNGRAPPMCSLLCNA